jgi:predicted transcriptional regulator
VPKRAEEQEQERSTSLVAPTTKIAAAYVIRNAVTIADLGSVIETVGRAVAALGREQAKPASAKPEPAVPVRRSIKDDHLVCLVCGKQQKALRRHLEVMHQLAPEDYRERFGLKPDYPMSAPSYARQRSQVAKRVGLGRGGRAAPRRRRRKDQE